MSPAEHANCYGSEDNNYWLLTKKVPDSNPCAVSMILCTRAFHPHCLVQRGIDRPSVPWLLKGLSHWRRRRRDSRDWSVAATRATRETKTWLALSRRGDVSETCWRLKNSPPPQNRTCLNFLRLPGDPASLQETSRRRLRNKRRLESPPSRHLVSMPVK